MSNIYIQEPPTFGKVLLTTTAGEIEIELWSKEAPKAARNFVQLCLEGYYNSTKFHRVVKDFIVQGGDPTGTGTGGESIYNEPFKDEIHSRIRFNRRGLVAMANSGKNDNGSQFFFTLAATPELQNKHTIFGKVVGETLFNMLKLGEVEVDDDEHPLFPQNILKTEVLNNPFNDIVPRIIHNENKNKEHVVKPKAKSAAVKNFKLLSFGDEAEEDEEEVMAVNKKLEGRSKSSYDLKPQKGINQDSESQNDSNNSSLEIEANTGGEESSSVKVKDINIAETVRNKLKLKKKDLDSASVSLHNNDEGKGSEDSRVLENKKTNIKKKNITGARKEYWDEINTYTALTKKIPKKGSSRESQTLELLNKFKKKVEKANAKLKHVDQEELNTTDPEKSEIWMAHVFKCPAKDVKTPKDANKLDGDWYDISDPRNTINKRRRGDNSSSNKKKDKSI